ncbi:MAG: hypothetical protein QNJ56_10855 [Gammaproteobacteria bacterium]|nr:hypothetical protein [Gammaproteobacteria bacterium]
MRHQTLRDQRKTADSKYRSLEWLLYLPGAMIIAYGLWLSITLN